MSNSAQKARLNTNEAAEFIGCAVSTLKISRCSGTLLGATAPRFLKLGTRKVLYEQSDLEEFLAKGQVCNSTAEYRVAS